MPAGRQGRPVRVLYSDLDGTMVGPGGSFFRAEDGTLTLRPAEQLVALLDAGVTLVLVSGRTRPQLVEACRVFGADGFIGELGSVIGWAAGRRSTVLRGQMPARLVGTPGQVLEDSGLVRRLLDRHPGRLEYHSPWHLGHEGDVMLRGRVDTAAVERWLQQQGFGWLRLHDNGVLPPARRSWLSEAALPAHVYHLMPAGVSKGAAVAIDLRRRGLRPDDAVAVGDSASDLTMAAAVRRMFVTGNGARQPHMAALLAGQPNVQPLDEPVGLGWARAVRWVLDGAPY